VDDHAIVRKGIRALLAEIDDIEVVGEAGDGREAVAQAQTAAPDVILMDLVMPVMGGNRGPSNVSSPPSRGAHPGADQLCRRRQGLSGESRPERWATCSKIQSLLI